jgi:hypothetical protein
MPKYGVLIASLTAFLSTVWRPNYELPEAQAGTLSKSAKWTLSQKQRIAIMEEASHAVKQYLHMSLKERKGNHIPQRLWGSAIRKLKPLRVVNDRVNVAIVLQESTEAEQGLYVRIPISSYAPGLDKRFATFEKLSKPEDKSLSELYRYTINRVQDSNAR